MMYARRNTHNKNKHKLAVAHNFISAGVRVFVCSCFRFLDAIQMESFGFVAVVVDIVVIGQLSVYKTTVTDCHITIHHLLNDADNSIRPTF